MTPRAQLGSFHENLRAQSVSDDDRRDFAKAVISMSTHGASSKPQADATGAPANDIAKVAEYWRRRYGEHAELLHVFLLERIY